ncbi:MAG TPA: hypothetical protein VM536_11860 [Chloroflexia bacterium]|nr:hypothetical protein [Chloroflexia bacterium]
MKQLSQLNPSWTKAVAVLTGTLLAALAGQRIAQTGVTIQDLIVVVLAGTAGATLLFGQAGVRVGFYCWILMFMLGYRVIHVTTYFGLHPLVLSLLGLLGILLIRISTFEQRTLSWVTPPAALALLPFWILGWLVGLVRGTPADQMLSESLNFVMLVPLLIVMDYVLVRPRDWKLVVALFYLTGTLIAVIGLLEYVLPGVTQFVPAAEIASAERQTGDDFARAAFLTWGSAVATFVCALAAPLIIPLWGWARTLPLRLGLAVAWLAMLGGIYIGGFRSLWVEVALCALFLLVLRKGWQGAAGAAVGLGVVWLLLPESGRARLLTLVAALQGQFEDTSSLDRWQRASGAWNAIVDNPFGLGWTGTGWVHSDFLQVGTDLGILAALLFLGWYLATFWSLLRRHLQEPGDLLLLGLLGSFLLAGGQLMSQGVTWLPQNALPLWFVWALVILRLRQAPAAPVQNEPA